MRKKGANNTNDALMITTAQLMQKMNCGYQTATKIGKEAKARICIGRCVWYNVKKIESYLEKIAV